MTLRPRSRLRPDGFALTMVVLDGEGEALYRAWKQEMLPVAAAKAPLVLGLTAASNSQLRRSGGSRMV